MPNKLIIVGVGETAAIAYEYFSCDSLYEISGFSVERNYIKETSFCGLPVVPFEEISDHFPPDEFDVFIAVSSTKLNRVRTRLFLQAKQKGYYCPSYVSSRAFVWRNVIVGENCFIFEDNTLQPFVKIGNNVVLWSGNHIGHNSVIGDNCFIASQVVVSGFCDIGENCFLGVNSTVINNITVGKDCFVGAGALIQKDAEAGRVYQSKGTEPAQVGSFRLFKIKE